MMRIAKASIMCFVFVFAACSMDKGGVQSDNNRPCPECPECDECPSDQPRPADPCQGVTYEGQCTEDGVVQWCENGELQQIDCATDGNVCGYDDELGYFDCLSGSNNPEPVNSSAEFTCTCGQILLDVQFALDSDGCIKNVLGCVKPADVEKVKFFVDQTDIATAPSADYNVESNSAVLELPGCAVRGNLFLAMRDESQAWADVGSFELAGASIDGGYMVVSCPASECTSQ